jgi:hypothetical protein
MDVDDSNASALEPYAEVNYRTNVLPDRHGAVAGRDQLIDEGVKVRTKLFAAEAITGLWLE